MKHLGAKEDPTLLTAVTYPLNVVGNGLMERLIHAGKIENKGNYSEIRLSFKPVM